MARAAFVAMLALAGCGRSQGVPDEDLGGLVVAPRPIAQTIDVARAAKDPSELGRALMLPEHVVTAAIGVHTTSVATTSSVEEGGKPVSDLTDQAKLELGDERAYHATYANSADYGREVIFTAGQLFLRPRYQRWHGRAPEAPDEPQQIADQFTEAIGATWDLLAPGAELTDLGPAQIAGRAGRKIAVKLSPSPRTPPSEPLAQRKWREKRSVDALSGEIVIDADKGVPLSVKLTGTIGYSRDGRRFAMKVSVQSEVSSVAQPAAVAAPPADQVVATPERMREVDDRDFLLQGMAPPLRKAQDPNATGTAGGSAAK